MKLATLALAATLTSACQTRTQALTVAGVSAGVAVASFAVVHSARDDEEGAPPLFPIAFLVGGTTAILSLIAAIGMEE